MAKPRFDKRLRIISRAEWGARKPKSRVTIHAPSKSYVHHTAGAQFRDPNWKERTFFKAACRYMQETQNFHMDTRGWADIAYSFIIMKPFLRRMWVFEGRGWNVAGAHTEGVNSSSYGFCAAGNFEVEKASRRLVYTFQRLIEYGLMNGKLNGPRSSHPTGGHFQAPGASTACPGKNLKSKLADMRTPTARWRRRHG